MNKVIAATSLAAALALVAPQAMAEDTKKMEPASETSDRTPEQATPTPDTQVDKTKEGETSDRTPEKKAGTTAGESAGTETSDRTPEKETMTPDTQVDKTKEGDTSDRTPEKK